MSNVRSKDAMEPLAISALAALTPDSFEREFYDERLEEVPLTLDSDIAAISVDSFAARRAYQLAAHYRKQGIKVVMGGYHPTLLPDEARLHCDALVAGEAEPVWENLLHDAARGELKPFYRGTGSYDPAGIRYDETIFKGKKYLKIVPVQAGRGCKFSCDFCSVSAFFEKKSKLRPVEQVLAEIRRRGGIYFALVDDNIFLDKTYTRNLLEGLKPLKKKWGCQVSLDITGHEELVALMAKSGCISVTIGFESLNRANLKSMKKTVNLKNDYEKAIGIFKKYGIMVHASFVFGYDGDRNDSFEKTLDFALEHNFFMANFNPLIPHPGTELYRRLKAEKRLIYDTWWNDSSYQYGRAFFTPRGMTSDELTGGCYRIRKKFNTYTNIVKRALDFKTNCKNPASLFVYLAGNLINRHEIYKKQGMLLGEQG